MSRFYVALGGERQGPFTLQQLLDRSVPLMPDSLVWQQGTADWMAASTVAPLAPLFVIDEAEPPPFIPAGSKAIDGRPETSTGPQWIVIYAMGVVPLLWICQRLINIAGLYAQRTDPEFATIALCMGVWAIVTATVTGTIFAGGRRLAFKSTRRSGLLRVGLILNVVLSLLIAVYFVIAVAVLIYQSTPTSSEPDDTLGAIAFLAGTVLCVLNFVVDIVAWFQLRRLTRK